jgi:hypothetical protein
MEPSPSSTARARPLELGFSLGFGIPAFGSEGRFAALLPTQLELSWRLPLDGFLGNLAIDAGAGISLMPFASSNSVFSMQAYGGLTWYFVDFDFMGRPARAGIGAFGGYHYGYINTLVFPLSTGDLTEGGGSYVGTRLRLDLPIADQALAGVFLGYVEYLGLAHEFEFGISLRLGLGGRF